MAILLQIWFSFSIAMQVSVQKAFRHDDDLIVLNRPVCIWINQMHFPTYLSFKLGPPPCPTTDSASRSCGRPETVSSTTGTSFWERDTEGRKPVLNLAKVFHPSNDLWGGLGLGYLFSIVFSSCQFLASPFGFWVSLLLLALCWGAHKSDAREQPCMVEYYFSTTLHLCLLISIHFY